MSASGPEPIKLHFVRLFEHLEWADNLVLGSLRAARNLQQRDLDLYSHIVAVEHVWLSRIKEQAPRVTVWPALRLDQAEQLSRETADALKQFAGSLTTEELNRPITYRNSAGDQFTSTVDDILTQVALHGAYHRGQIASSIRSSGDTPAPTDYIAFVRGAPAATRQG